MPTDVIMPQMGESIFEGTLTKWLKKPGDKVQRDEPLFEISTDKVDAEIPAPASGVLKEVKVQEGATVQVNTVVGIIDGEGGAAASAAAPAKAAQAEPAKVTGAPSAASTNGPSRPAAAAPPRSAPEPDETETESSPAQSAQPSNVTEISHAEGERVRSSPLVRKIAKENNVDLGRVPGTGMGGRITKDDILSFIQKYPAGGAQPAQRPASPTSAPAPQAAAAPAPAMPAPTPGDVVPMTKMRSIIAQRMVESKHTSAHVHTVFKVDMTRIVKLRDRERAKFEARNG